jgi:hypothetical protein
MLRLEVVRVGGGPVAIQSCSNLPVFHLDLPSCMRRVGPEAPLSDRKQMIEALDEAFTEQMKGYSECQLI